MTSESIRSGIISSAGADIKTTSRLIVRHCGNAHPHFCRYLAERHRFSDLCRYPFDPGSKGKLAHLKDSLGDLFFAMRNLRRVRASREIIAIGPMACAVALMLRLGFLPECRHVWWLGLFVHSPRWLQILRPFFRLVDSPRMRYVLFSEYEKPLYVRAFGFDLRRLFYLPYGDMSEAQSLPDVEVAQKLAAAGEKFFFSGGYTSRDYTSLIKVFTGFSCRLVIACGSLNTEVSTEDLPDNITLLRDISFETFEAYAAALACIIPIAHDTGAAGQSVLLSHMQHHKIVIATDTGIIREYIQDGVSGILVRDNQAELAAAVRRVAGSPADYQHYGDAAYDRYVGCFSRETIARKLDQLVLEEMSASGSNSQHST